MIERIEFIRKDFTERVDLVDRHFADQTEIQEITIQEIKKMMKDSVEEKENRL